MPFSTRSMMAEASAQQSRRVVELLRQIGVRVRGRRLHRIPAFAWPFARVVLTECNSYDAALVVLLALQEPFGQRRAGLRALEAVYRLGDIQALRAILRRGFGRAP